MAKSLRQYTYTGKSIASRPGASSNDQKSPEKQTEMADTKAEILSLLRNDIPTLLRAELKTVLADEFNNMRSELHAVKTEVVGNIALLRSDL
ncbi:Cochlin [Labeo rohita]|uniref:Cochlin n=1 Tax=Labeo rohita TaxID=84645 RepID=A0ABQ8L5G2_LABRO|nr:Cochlin [Labeo rohita]